MNLIKLFIINIKLWFPFGIKPEISPHFHLCWSSRIVRNDHTCFTFSGISWLVKWIENSEHKKDICFLDHWKSIFELKTTIPLRMDSKQHQIINLWYSIKETQDELNLCRKLDCHQRNVRELPKIHSHVQFDLLLIKNYLLIAYLLFLSILILKDKLF